MTGQTRLESLVEAVVNILIGFGVNFAFNLVILPAVGLPMPTLGQNFILGCLFTIVSLCRSYLIRRWFNARLVAMSRRIARAIDESSKT